MATRRQKFEVGVFLIVCIGAIAIVLYSLSSLYKQPGVHYQIEFTESVQGLYDGAMVTYIGVSIGKVEHISVTPQHTALVRIAVDPSKVTLSEGVQAQLSISSFASGTMSVSLLGPDKPGKPLKEGSKIETKTSTITAISERIEDLMANITDIAAEVDKGLKGMKEGDLNAIVKKVDKALDDGSKMLEDAKGAVADVRKVTEKVNARVDSLLDQVDSLAKDAHKLSKDADDFLVTAKDKIAKLDVESAQRSLDDILKQLSELGKKVDTTLSSINDVTSGAAYQIDDVQYSLRQTLQEVTTTFGAVQRIVDVLKKDPSSLIRGRAVPQEPKP